MANGKTKYQLIRREIGRELSLVRRRMRAMCSGERGVTSRLSSHFFSHDGKMIRASLILLLARVSGGIDRTIIDFAAGVELIHAASLIHDDIIDNERVRRGMATLNDGFGNTQAVLFGDLVFVRAFELFHAIDCRPLSKKVLAVIGAMCEAQIQEDVLRGNDKVSRDQYLSVIGGKTAALFEICGYGVDVLKGLNRPAVRRFGYDLGMAFQLLDDANDLPSGEDIAEGFFTYPFIHAVRRAPLRDRRMMKALAATKPFGTKEAHALTRCIEDAGGIEANNRLAYDYLSKALRAVRTVTAASKGLTALIDDLIARSGMHSGYGQQWPPPAAPSWRKR
ncbi:MAG: polyprenyl synthetase family protein [Spirochaetota bacterium]